MNRAILVAIVYIIVAGVELLAYYLSKSDCVYFYGFITLIAFIFTFGAVILDDITSPTEALYNDVLNHIKTLNK